MDSGTQEVTQTVPMVGSDGSGPSTLNNTPLRGRPIRFTTARVSRRTVGSVKEAKLINSSSDGTNVGNIVVKPMKKSSKRMFTSIKINTKDDPSDKQVFNVYIHGNGSALIKIFKDESPDATQEGDNPSGDNTSVRRHSGDETEVEEQPEEGIRRQEPNGSDEEEEGVVESEDQ